MKCVGDYLETPKLWPSQYELRRYIPSMYTQYVLNVQHRIILFCFYRSLHCGRITMHKNLFMSMSLNNMIWIIWYSCVLFQPEVWSTNPTWCRVLHVLVQYFMITTYSWMLCEGAYLQLLLMNTWGVKRWQLSTLIGRQIVIYYSLLVSY